MASKKSQCYDLSMSDERVDAIVNNEIEWRREIYKTVKSLEQRQHKFELQTVKATTTLSVKYGLISFLSGTVGGALLLFTRSIIGH